MIYNLIINKIKKIFLKNEFGLSSFHERKVTMKLINKLIYEHLKLTIINFNGDNVVLTLDKTDFFNELKDIFKMG